MTLPTRYTINGVPWGDCACCDMASCVWHTEHPDRDAKVWRAYADRELTEDEARERIDALRAAR